MSVIDEFRSTQRTFIVHALSQGDDEAVRRHVMARAYEPLCAYARESSLRAIGPAEDLVGGFFASRFARREYLRRWVVHPGGMPLRRWLVNGLILYAREQLADRQRDRGRWSSAAGEHTDLQAAAGASDRPWTSFERRWRNRLLELACDRVSAQLDAEGRPEAWTLFIRHVLEGVPYAVLERSLGVRAQQAPMLTRTILRRLRSELTELLGDEFGTDSEIDDELTLILGSDD